MLRRFLIALCIVFGFTAAYAGPVANIEWVHGAINNIWGVEIPYHKDLKNSRYASNMEYLLNAVDRVNYVINGFESSQYRKDSRYATKYVANVETAEEAINELIQPKGLIFRTLRTTTSFSILLSAQGNFTIDWGDGTVDEISRTNTTQTTYSHTYDKAGIYYIKPRGAVTAYNSDGNVPAIKIGTPAALAILYGSLGSVFPTLSNGSQPSFKTTFAGCSNLRSKIPENLFEGIHGQADKTHMFAQLFDGCTKLQGPIPEGLFSGVTGKPTYAMFEAAFRNCQSMTGNIPEKLFQSLAGDITDYMFSQLFMNCSSLSGSIPGDLFKTITGRPSSNAFYRAFRSCVGLTGRIPGTLFQGLSGAPSYNSFAETFAMAKNLSGTIPENLFAGVKGQIATATFWGTFMGCRGLWGPLPPKLFAGLTGTADHMFRQVFHQAGGGICNNMPENLFATIKGPAKPYMFASAFIDCGASNIPAKLFSGIYGPPAEGMFESAFHWNGIGALPAGLFAGISGAPAPYMFKNTFDSVSGITSIGAPLFGDIRGPAANQMFYGMFNGSSAIKGPSAQMAIKNADGTTENHFIYEFWDMTSNQATYNSRASGMDDYACIPTTWGGGGTKDVPACLANWPFTLTTTSTSSFGFDITAAGKFYVDWGDGTYETIEKSDTTRESIGHSYATAGEYTIRMAGIASDYDAEVPVITFGDPYSIAGIDGSIGKVFSTLPDGRNPSFARLFEDAANLTSEIPEELFSGIMGQPVPGMFAYTFCNCTGLTGEIPAGLFAGLDGEPVENLFDSTFALTSELSSAVPSELFAGIKGAPAPNMFWGTFQQSGINSIPGDLFSGIKGAPADGMFMYTFYDGGLTDLPEGLFAGIKGAPAPRMYASTFHNNINITGEIPLGFFGDISGPGADDMFGGTFEGCGGLTGYSARDKNGEFLYNIWPEADFGQYCYGTYYQTPNKLTDWNCIPEAWGGPNTGSNAACIGNWPLTMTVEGTQFSMQFAFEGEAYVDWGDGEYETFDGLSSASHTYSTSGTHKVRIAARPIAYYGADYPVFEITTPYALQELHGSLGQVFPTLADGSNPAFIQTFQGAVNLTTLPETLFDGLSGTAVPYMFEYTFSDCTGLTELPTYLFEGVNVPAEGMFTGTFDNCTGLTSIPENLLSHLELGANPPEYMFEDMFAGCTGLRGESAKINGMYLYDEYGMVPDVFTGMYLNCTGLTDYANIPMSWKSQAE